MKIKEKTCKVYSAPFEVRLETIDIPEQIINVFEPDLSIICDRNKLDDRGCKGAPDWIIEPDENIVSVFTLGANQRYGRPEMYAGDDKIIVKTLESLEINLEMVFSWRKNKELGKFISPSSFIICVMRYCSYSE